MKNQPEVVAKATALATQVAGCNLNLDTDSNEINNDWVTQNIVFSTLRKLDYDTILADLRTMCKDTPDFTVEQQLTSQDDRVIVVHRYLDHGGSDMMAVEFCQSCTLIQFIREYPN